MGERLQDQLPDELQALRDHESRSKGKLDHDRTQHLGTLPVSPDGLRVVETLASWTRCGEDGSKSGAENPEKFEGKR